jgi:hypothetical protein
VRLGSKGHAIPNEAALLPWLSIAFVYFLLDGDGASFRRFFQKVVNPAVIAESASVANRLRRQVSLFVLAST